MNQHPLDDITPADALQALQDTRPRRRWTRRRIVAVAAAIVAGAAIAAAALLWHNAAADPAPAVSVPAGTPFDYADYVDAITGTTNPAPPVTSWVDLMLPPVAR